MTFSVQDRFFFHRMNTKSSIFTSGKATSEIPLFVFMSEIKNDLTLKKSNFLFLLCLKIAAIHFISMRPFTGQRHNFFSSRCASNSMLPAYLLGMLLVET